ncbi:hypothetical protein [Actinokineospora iranica]|uniref:Uncharacterized protein n=1 Tax=Actinokineospora iranica TaxID=1271860 RepID=A0A1G6Q714_9PSEU|nr:hypothetical protein [Actinokineospora iranica]SDC87506.1 hypothetical protein SAMN05216174_10598 [Actinokineospora iranica]
MKHSDKHVAGFVVVGLLTLPFYKADDLREKFVGSHVVPPGAALAVLLLALAVATLSLLRRDHVWINPAHLTWDDSGDRDRPIRLRLRLAWAVRFGVVGYLFAAAALVLGWPPLGLSAVLFVATAVFAYRWAARPVRGWAVELAVPFLLAVLAALFAGGAVLWAAAAVLAVAALGATGPPGRARRDELVRGWNARVLRSVSAAFGDFLALLPTARPVKLRLTNTVRYVVAGVLARRQALPLALLLALAVPVLHRVFPVVDPLWWTGLGAYFVALPFGGALTDLRVAGRRRWLPATNRTIKATTLVVLTVVGLAWAGLTVLFGLPFAPAALPIAALAAVRTAARPDIDFTVQGAVDVGGMYAPIGLVYQLVRGPDLLLFGLLVVSGF